MGSIERAVKHYREPKPMNASTGIWINGGVTVWENRSGKAKIPKKMRERIADVLSSEPENIEMHGFFNMHKRKDIIEVKFLGKDGKPDQIEILKAHVHNNSCRGGQIEIRSAHNTYKQIKDLIAEKRKKPEEIYWERNVSNEHDGIKTQEEHIEITIPFREIKKQFEPTT